MKNRGWRRGRQTRYPLSQAMKRGEILKASSEATNRFRKGEGVGERVLGRIDGKVAQKERVHVVYLIPQASQLRGEARGRRFCTQRQIFAQRLSEARGDG